MEPAQTIIKKLGGPSAVAEVLGIHRTRVSAWQRSRESGGTDGQIPQRHFGALLDFANESKIPLSEAELVARAAIGRRSRRRVKATAKSHAA